MAKNTQSVYKAQDKQVLFHKAAAEEILYGGAAGGGKSKAILWDAVTKALQHKTVRIGIFRRTYPELEKSLIFNFLNEVPYNIYEYSKKEHRALFTKTKSVIDFNHCQHESDVYKFQSVEYDFLYFDELTHFTEFIYQYLLSRLRTTDKKIKPQVKSGSNPGNVGHLWVKKRFIDDCVPYEVNNRVITDSEGFISNYTSQFIPATLYDNKILMEADPGYEDRLKRLATDDRKALLDGDWNVFKGQFFKEWNPTKHICDPFAIPTSWRRFVALDWGYANPSAAVWITISPENKLFVYRELYVTETSIPELASKILSLSENEKIEYYVADPSMWSVTQFEKGESIAMRLMENGLRLVKADNSRLSGWSAVRDVLYYDKNKKDSEPILKVFSTCLNFIKTVPAQVHDQRKVEDLDTNGEDHIADALRYGIMSNPHLLKQKSSSIVVANTFDTHFKKIRVKRTRHKYVGSR